MSVTNNGGKRISRSHGTIKKEELVFVSSESQNESKKTRGQNIFKQWLKLPKFSERQSYRCNKQSAPPNRINMKKKKTSYQDSTQLNFIQTENETPDRNGTLLTGKHMFKKNPKKTKQ